MGRGSGNATPQTPQADTVEELRDKVARMSRLNRILAIAAAVVMVAALATPTYRFVRAAALASSCHGQQQEVEKEAQSFRASNLDFPNEVAELAAGDGLACPAGGDYIWNPVDGTLSCTEHGHWNGDGGPAVP